MTLMDSETPELHPTSPRAASWWGAVLLSALTATLVTAGIFWLGPGAAGEAAAPAQAAPPRPEGAPSASGPVQVPRIVGVDVGLAGDLLAARGLRVQVTEQRPDPTRWEGTILEQTPLPGSHAPAGEEVRVVVAAADRASEVSLPHLAGQSLAEARRALESLGLRVGPVVPTDADPDALVLSSVPAGGEAIQRGAMVGLGVELSGPTVPDVIGRSWTTARKAFKAAGLQIGEVRERFDERYRAWVVLETYPAPGTRVLAGSTVAVVRNEGD